MAATNRGQSNKFFYRYLTLAAPDQIVNLITQFEQDREDIEEQVIEVIYGMRGGITLEEGFMLSPQQRVKYIEKIISLMSASKGMDDKDLQ